MEIFPSALWHNHYIFGTDCRVLIKPIKDAESLDIYPQEEIKCVPIINAPVVIIM